MQVLNFLAFSTSIVSEHWKSLNVVCFFPAFSSRFFGLCFGKNEESNPTKIAFCHKNHFCFVQSNWCHLLKVQNFTSDPRSSCIWHSWWRWSYSLFNGKFNTCEWRQRFVQKSYFRYQLFARIRGSRLFQLCQHW